MVRLKDNCSTNTIDSLFVLSLLLFYSGIDHRLKGHPGGEPFVHLLNRHSGINLLELFKERVDIPDRLGRLIIELHRIPNQHQFY